MKTAKEILEKVIAEFDRCVEEADDFRSEVQKKSITHVLELNTKNAMLVEQLQSRLKWARVFREKMEKGEKIGEDEITYDYVVSVIKAKIDKCVQDLVRKPWQYNSTSAVANILNSVKADAIVEEMSIYSKIIGQDCNYKIEITCLFI